MYTKYAQSPYSGLGALRPYPAFRERAFYGWFYLSAYPVIRLPAAFYASIDAVWWIKLGRQGQVGRSASSTPHWQKTAKSWWFHRPQFRSQFVYLVRLVESWCDLALGIDLSLERMAHSRKNKLHVENGSHLMKIQGFQTVQQPWRSSVGQEPRPGTNGIVWSRWSSVVIKEQT